ncbi:hypothetical protein QBC43DRAFT_256012 [Cladorrhinum sp. PSN259]|nr:hypothetical protein QBC43DRAFT_256012 [Cladorrhinum sp. PSN259]
MATTGIFDFGGKNLKTLYDDYNSKAKVFEFLDAVIASATDPLKTELTTIRSQIALLSAPDGNEYSGGAARPRQHIRRVVTPAWRNWVANASKFAVQANSPGHWWAKQAGTRPYWSPFDLLGLFFAKMGPAPNFATANEANFYLPLTAVYARFCMWIGFNKKPAVTGARREGRRGQGVGDPSFYFQCTWDPQTGDFFLGAVLAGYEWALRGADDTGSWQDALRRKRYSLLSGFHDFPGTYTTWEESPTRIDRPGSQVFGNCAETYPFLEMLGPHVDQLDTRRRMEGLALQREFAEINKYDAAKVKRKVAPPCANCQQLLRWAGSTNPADYHFDPKKPRPVAVDPAPDAPVTLSSDAPVISPTGAPAATILPADPPTVPLADPPTVPQAVPTGAS